MESVADSGHPSDPSHRLPFLGHVPAINELLVAQGMPILALAVIGLLTAAVLGPSGKGVASLAVAIASLGGILCCLSLHVGVVRATYSGDLRAIFRALGIAIVVAAVPLAFGLATGIARAGVGSSERQRALLIGLSAIIPEALGLVILRTVQGLGGNPSYRTATVLRMGTYMAIVIVLVATTRLTPVGVIGAFVAGSLVGLVYGGLALRRILATAKTPRGLRRVPVVRRSLLPHLAGLSGIAVYRTDLIILGALASSAQVGQYAFATAIAEVPGVIPSAVGLSVFATTARARTASDDVTIDRTLHQAIRAYLPASLIAAAIIAGVSYPFISGLFPAFRPAFALTLILLPGVVLGGVGNLIGYSAMAADRRGLVMYSAIANLGLLPVYVPFILAASATGAAIASDVIYITTAAIMVVVSRRERLARSTDSGVRMSGRLGSG